MKLAPQDNVAVALRPLRAGEAVTIDGSALTVDRDIAIGHKIAVCDIAELLTGKRLDTRRFYLLATRKYENQLDWIAIPVSGECELINVEIMDASANDSPHVDGWLSFGGEVIEVLRLSALTPGPAEKSLPAPLRDFAEARS